MFPTNSEIVVRVWTLGPEIPLIQTGYPDCSKLIVITKMSEKAVDYASYSVNCPLSAGFVLGFGWTCPDEIIRLAYVGHMRLDSRPFDG